MRSGTSRTLSIGGRLLAAAVMVATAVAAPGLPAASAAAAPRSLPAIPNLNEQYWFGNLRIGEVWKLGATGQNVTVAVLDSGVDAGAVELSGANILSGTDFAGGNGQTETDTEIGHGTAMATLIAGQGGGSQNLTGIAPSAKILPVTASPGSGSGSAGRWPQSIRWAVDHGAKVISMSLGEDSVPDGCPAQLADAVRYAIGKGSVVVAAAGNTGNAANEPDYPAQCPGVVAVGAVGGNKVPWAKTQRQNYVDLAAPGVQFPARTPAGQIGESDGTSNATALVAGELALVWSKLPNLTNRQVIARLLATATDDAQTPGRDSRVGYGISRPYFAITQNVSATAPNPIFDEVSNGGSSSAPATSASAASSANSSSGPQTDVRAEGGSGGTSPLLIALIVVIVLVLIAAIALVARSRRRSAHAGGPPPGYQPGPPYGHR